MTKELKANELEHVSGGSFIPNNYSDEEYRDNGILVFNNIITPDLFFWKGEQINYANANHVMQFIEANGRQPDSLDEAEAYCQTSKGHKCKG